MKGWYKQNESIGIIFNEISSDTQNSQTNQQYALNKVWGNLTEYLGLARFDKLELSYQIFPGDFVTLPKVKPGDMSQHLDLFVPPPAKKAAFADQKNGRYRRQPLCYRFIHPCLSPGGSAH